MGPNHEIRLEPLTASAFAPFGHVVIHDRTGRRSRIPAAFEQAADGTPAIWLARVETPALFPIEVTALERHPHSPQTFIPRGDHAHIVVVARSDAAGEPDPASVRAFLARGDQGVVYARNCWHLGLTPIETPCEFVVTMIETGLPDETVLSRLPDMVSIHPLEQ